MYQNALVSLSGPYSGPPTLVLGWGVDPGCLENPRDGRGWWAAIYGVSQSQTRLK